jgi:hypothetical protein
VQIDPFLERLPCDRSIHRAGIDVAVIQPRRNRARDGSFAGAGRTIDRDDELRPARGINSHGFVCFGSIVGDTLIATVPDGCVCCNRASELHS